MAPIRHRFCSVIIVRPGFGEIDSRTCSFAFDRSPESDHRKRETFDTRCLCWAVENIITMGCTCLSSSFRPPEYFARCQFRSAPQWSNTSDYLLISELVLNCLGLIVEFVRGHLMKRLPYRLYGWVLFHSLISCWLFIFSDFLLLVW